MKMQMHSVPEVAARFVGFLHASPTPFHAVHYASVRLEAAGFRKVL
jgi:aspartyl aminopeptidase